ncbi:SWIM zinc finger family protein [Aeribacillus sp. FSL K6-8394]|uniref:SWIM zinc finger family protein n=1 Tax=Aeribacillus sp. FSL K6-8394 TaxID=2954570 RepID=UPI0030F68C30
MPSHIFDKQLVLHCSEQVINMLSPETEEQREWMKKGFLLYRQGNVFNVKQEGIFITAAVEDVKRAHVKLDLEYFQLSSCSCSNEFPCRHLIAVFLYIYAFTDDLGNFFSKLKENPNKKLAMWKEEGLIQKGMKPSEQPADDWAELFKGELDNVETLFGTQRIYAIWHKVYPLLKKKEPKNRGLKPLYHIMLASSLLVEICRFCHQNETNTNSPALFQYAAQVIEELQLEIIEHVKQIKTTPLPFSADPILHDMRDHIRELLFCGKAFLYERVVIYRIIWEHLLNRKKWIEEERTILEHRKDDEMKKGGLFILECELAIFHFDFLDKKDDRIIHYLNETELPLLPLLFDWIISMNKRKEFKRFRKWVPVILDQANLYIQVEYFYDRQETIYYLLNEFEHYRAQVGDDETFEHACRKLLPYSYAVYHEYLIEKGLFHTWAELQLSIGFSLDDVESRLLTVIEKKAPGVLLPLLHQEIAGKIAVKKRSSYKDAVKYLKRLKRVYKKMGDMDTWEHYFQHITSEYKRLRAFQEELVKGKLM